MELLKTIIAQRYYNLQMEQIEAVKSGDERLELQKFSRLCELANVIHFIEQIEMTEKETL